MSLLKLLRTEDLSVRLFSFTASIALVPQSVHSSVPSSEQDMLHFTTNFTLLHAAVAVLHADADASEKYGSEQNWHDT